MTKVTKRAVTATTPAKGRKAVQDPRTGAAPASGASVTAQAPTSHVHDSDLGRSERRRVNETAGADARAVKDDVVTVRIPRAFKLHVLNGDGTGSSIIDYDAGINEMPRSHAEHDYSKDNGVEIVD